MVCPLTAESQNCYGQCSTKENSLPTGGCRTAISWRGAEKTRALRLRRAVDHQAGYRKIPRDLGEDRVQVSGGAVARGTGGARIFEEC